MADNTRVGGGFGDSQPLLSSLPGVVISDGRVGVRELVNGQLQHRMLKGELDPDETYEIQTNLNTEQRLFQGPPQ